MGRPRYQVVGPLDDKLLCLACRQLLDKPTPVSCGHFFCRDCVHGPANRRRHLHSCPACAARLDYPHEATLPAWVAIALDTVIIRCPQGCDKEVRLRRQEEHIGKECPNDMLLCPNHTAGCRVKVIRGSVEEHLERCLYRRVPCPACSQEVVSAELFKHQMKKKCHERAMKVELARTFRRCNMQVKEHNQAMKEELQRSMQENRRVVLTHWGAMGIKGFDRFARDASGGRASKRSDLSLRLAEARPKCAHCAKAFSPTCNHETACAWHAGPIIETFGGLCLACGRPNHQTGCLLGFHAAPS